MTKEELLRIMRLLSALEVVGLMRDKTMPDHIWEELDDCVKILEREILK